jgi:hypothetical protein
VVSFNGLVAGQAVSEVIQLLVGFRGSGLLRPDLELSESGVFRGYKKFDGVAGTLAEWGGVRKPGRSHCKGNLGASMGLGVADCRTYEEEMLLSKGTPSRYTEALRSNCTSSETSQYCLYKVPTPPNRTDTGAETGTL